VCIDGNLSDDAAFNRVKKLSLSTRSASDLETLSSKFPEAQTLFIDDDAVDLKNHVYDLITSFIQSRKSGWDFIVWAKTEGPFSDADKLKFRDHGVKVDTKDFAYVCIKKDSEGLVVWSGFDLLSDDRFPVWCKHLEIDSFLLGDRS